MPTSDPQHHSGTPAEPARMNSAASLLDEISRSFTLLTAGPQPLAIDGREVGFGLPPRPIPLTEMLAILLHPSCSPEARDAVWERVVRSAQTGDPQWMLGAAGLALPGLRTMAAGLARGHQGSTADLDAELVAGFVEHLRSIDPDAGDLCGRLCWRAFQRALRAKTRDQQHAHRRADLPASASPQLPWGHPDLVLIRAVQAGVITADEAELISRTRLGGDHVTTVAKEQRINRRTLASRRETAEARLVAAIRNGDL
ncbi:hypothetical protein [Fodinicola acaciae]|uniref:hypothetical protein n=1 Tax=Fodinicola acaciae TaxID=2681555 RepID=UPI0013CFD4F9|nr:hypothetical protein [Fodinicola acaciae]